MSARRFRLTEIGDITLHKRKGARNIRLSLAHDGTIRLTMPAWMPYRVGLEFIQQKQDWIIANRQPTARLRHGVRVGKQHSLLFRDAPKTTRPSVRVKDNQIVVSLPPGYRPEDDDIQLKATRGCLKALKQEAEAVLPDRLAFLAQKHGFTYNSVRIKQLKSRWGSCNQDNDIILNCFLIQLPADLIDYVLTHELLHTRILAHGRPFWQELGKYVNDLPAIRRVMRQQRPHLLTE